MKIKGIDHVAVQTSDIDKAIKFYVEILGLRLVERRPFKKREMAWLSAGDVRIELFSKRAGETLAKWDDGYSGPVHISFLVDEVEAFVKQALAQGAQMHPSHPELFIPPVPGATAIAYLLGPDGEEVEIRAR